MQKAHLIWKYPIIIIIGTLFLVLGIRFPESPFLAVSRNELPLFLLGAALLLIFKYAFLFILEGIGGSKSLAQKQEMQSNNLLFALMLITAGSSILEEYYGTSNLGFLFFFVILFSFDYRLLGREMTWWEILSFEIIIVLSFALIPLIGIACVLAGILLVRKNKCLVKRNDEATECSSPQQGNRRMLKKSAIVLLGVFLGGFLALSNFIWLPDVFLEKKVELAAGATEDGTRFDVVQYWNHVDFYNVEIVISKRDGSKKALVLDGDAPKWWTARVTVDENAKALSIFSPAKDKSALAVVSFSKGEILSTQGAPYDAN
jgi:hypothetical protein